MDIISCSILKKRIPKAIIIHQSSINNRLLICLFFFFEGTNEPSDSQTTLNDNLIFLAAGIIRPFLIFVTEETFLGQLFDAYIYRMKLKLNKFFLIILFIKVFHKLQRFLCEIIQKMKFMFRE